MEKDEMWDHDCESSDGEIKSVVYTVISVLGCLLTVGLGLLTMILVS